MMSGMRNSPPISISSPRETTTSRPWASVSSARSTAAALITGRSEKRPVRRARSTTRTASASAAAGAACPSRARRRSASSVSRTSAVNRARGTPWSSGRPASARRRWSTEGRPRSAASRSALIERGLDLLADARDDLLRLVAPGLRGPLPVAGLAAAAHGLLDETGPQLVEVRRGETLTTEGARPLRRETVDELVALGGEAPRLPNEVRQPGRHGLRPDELADGV